MPRQPTVETGRLLLRPFRTADADAVQRLAGDRAVADTTLNVPHPYEDGMAEKWIANHRDWFDRGQQAVFAIVLRSAATPLGAIELRINREDQRGELGYWIGRPHWNQGYCTEAGRAMLRFGFESLDLNRIFAHHFARNPASGRVLQKLGMTHEGCLRQHVRKWDGFEDLELYAILKSQWAS
jgi:RimJ/RimL family protein N-acetyltransferase